MYVFRQNNVISEYIEVYKVSKYAVKLITQKHPHKVSSNKMYIHRLYTYCQELQHKYE